MEQACNRSVRAFFYGNYVASNNTPNVLGPQIFTSALES